MVASVSNVNIRNLDGNVTFFLTDTAVLWAQLPIVACITSVAKASGIVAAT